jgi:hypothetical protein
MRIVEVVENMPTSFVKGPSLLRQPKTAGGSLEKPYLELSFQLTHCLPHG